MSFFNAALNIVVITIYVILNLTGLTLISAQQILSINWLTGIFLYGLGFIIWILLILRSMPLSIAFPLAAGSLIIGTQIFGWYFLNEKISAGQFGGVFMILVGLCLIYANGLRG